MKHTRTITTNDSDTLLCPVVGRKGSDGYTATIVVTGTFGSGTIALKLSVDGGTTKVSLKDQNGDAIAITANDAVQIPVMGFGAELDGAPLLYASLSGATNPSLTVTVLDNR